MVLTEGANGSIVADGTEQNLFASQTVLKHYVTWLFVNNMVDGDELTVRTFVNDVNASLEKIYEEQIIFDSQSEVAVFLPFVPTDSYRVTIQQGVGPFKTFTWVRYES